MLLAERREDVRPVPERSRRRVWVRVGSRRLAGRIGDHQLSLDVAHTDERVRDLFRPDSAWPGAQAPFPNLAGVH